MRAFTASSVDKTKLLSRVYERWYLKHSSALQQTCLHDPFNNFYFVFDESWVESSFFIRSFTGCFCFVYCSASCWRVSSFDFFFCILANGDLVERNTAQQSWNVGIFICDCFKTLSRYILFQSTICQRRFEERPFTVAFAEMRLSSLRSPSELSQIQSVI